MLVVLFVRYICDIKRDIFLSVFIFTILFKGISFVKQFSSLIYFAREARVDRRSRACEAKLRSCKRGSRAVYSRALSSLHCVGAIPHTHQPKKNCDHPQNQPRLFGLFFNVLQFYLFILSKSKNINILRHLSLQWKRC